MDFSQVFAMPETALGLFPDVGASYYLSRLPGFFGNGSYIIDIYSNSLDTKSSLKKGWSSFSVGFWLLYFFNTKFSRVVQFLFVGFNMYDWLILLCTSSIGVCLLSWYGTSDRERCITCRLEDSWGTKSKRKLIKKERGKKGSGT